MVVHNVLHINVGEVYVTTVKSRLIVVHYFNLCSVRVLGLHISAFHFGKALTK